MAEHPVAFFRPWDTAQPDGGNFDGYYIPIPRQMSFDIGRQWVQEFLGVQDRCVSNHHIRIHCVTYNEDDVQQRVAPMVYMRVLSSNGVVLRRHGIDDMIEGGMHVDKDMGEFLLNPGDRVQLTAKVGLKFVMFENNGYKAPAFDDVEKLEVQAFRGRYQLTSRILGIGGFARVCVAVKHSTGQQLACKMISFYKDVNGRHCNSREARQMKASAVKEYTVLQNLSHPNIISLERVIYTPHNAYIFQELVTGGDLMSYLDMQNDSLTEPVAAMILRQLLEAVNYLHDNNVVHRDIKTENILVTSWRDGARIVLTDFGHARLITNTQAAEKKARASRMHTVVGTRGFMAPEIYYAPRQGDGYSQAVDIWSIGCVTGALIASNLIFPDSQELRDGNTTFSQFTSHVDVIDTEPEWLRLSRTARDLIKGCLEADAEHRLTASQCLQHEWFQCAGYKDEFDAAYQRAIQDWTPKKFDKSAIEEIDTSELVRNAGVPDPAGEESQYWTEPKPAAQDLRDQLARFRPAVISGLHASPVRAPEPTPRQAMPPSSMFQPSALPSSRLPKLSAVRQWTMPDSLRDLQPPNSMDEIVDFSQDQPSPPEHDGIPDSLAAVMPPADSIDDIVDVDESQAPLPRNHARLPPLKTGGAFNNRRPVQHLRQHVMHR